MKRAILPSLFIIISIVLGACSTTTPTPVAADPMEFITDFGGREITVGVENTYPPFNMLDPDTGEGIGWDYDVYREICRRLNCVPVFVEIMWPPFEMMAAGELDTVGDGITIKLNRSQVVDYSDPYIEYGMIMMMRTDNVYETAEDFANSDARVASQAGTTNEAAALALVGEDRIDNYVEWPIGVLALLAGDDDGMAIDAVAAVAYIQEYPDELMAGFALTSGELLALIYPPGSPLQGPFNKAIQDMLNDGTMDAICQEWLLTNCSSEEEL
ncbi:MAG: amino acid ABC transporter substrate-binding protein [Anaerolineales bacterium]|nr:MAG: amino acid ABC transporter substrate-binding protein [Anaerolineales bacterium]